MVGLKEPLNISSSILKELVSRWSAEHQSFRVRQHLVPFSPYDVCITLGLGISGINVELQDDEGGIVKKLFGGEDTTIASIVKKLNDTKLRKKDVDVLCRLYILLGFVVFYFPRTSRSFLSFPFSLLDNLDSLSMYNWGEAAHGLPVSSLGRACSTLNMQKTSAGVHLSLWKINLLLKFIN